jgi:hypothetical protein
MYLNYNNNSFKIEKFASNYNGCLWALDLQGRLFYRTGIIKYFLIYFRYR